MRGPPACHPQLMAQVQTRLSTTVEEDAARREQQAVPHERRERAAAERLQLEHKVCTAN